ncbi:TldD/PmbA family protein [Clostridium guangxiense]|uniref:TldD/PmbA family protein n=1 Tax=Clostridium guangxiense TaxID=1662055 RepID=UPI001E49A159|nr:TldD/PmbA family protein [Clostridium guangxiense]MCD2347797.1 TldD/PmbA family protein [Clostridium guangxiense]
MINKIKSILEDEDVSEYKIIETRTSSEELFLVKKDIDMTRSKDVQHFEITVYKDFKENGLKYRGSSVFNVDPTMTEDEIKKLIRDNIFAAGFVKNEYYDIPKINNDKLESIYSKFAEGELSDWMPKLIEALYKNDDEEKGGINSAEIFLNKNYKRIIASYGVDSSYYNYDGMIEFITTWKEKEEIELYKMLTFSDYDPDYISNSVKDMIFLAKERAKAKETVRSGKYKIILSGSPVKEVLSYYVNNSRASNVYNKISTFKLAQLIQGKEVKGDLINLILDPKVRNSIYSEPVDDDGVALHKITVIKNGKLEKYHGDLRHSYYLNTKVTGDIKNFVVEPGSKSIDDMRKEPYLELVAFSDFQMDSTTGDFGGEVRLGWYFDGEKTIPITGGSLNANIDNLHDNIFLSKETQSENGFVGPKAIEMHDVVIAGR